MVNRGSCVNNVLFWMWLLWLRRVEFRIFRDGYVNCDLRGLVEIINLFSSISLVVVLVL